MNPKHASKLFWELEVQELLIVTNFPPQVTNLNLSGEI